MKTHIYLYQPGVVILQRFVGRLAADMQLIKGLTCAIGMAWVAFW